MADATVLPIQIDAAAILAQGASTLTEVAELERHTHNQEWWYGKGAGNLADNTVLVGWTLTAGNGGAYGAVVELDDGTKICGGLATCCYDFRRLYLSGLSSNNATYKIQFLTGAAIGTAVVLTEIVLGVAVANTAREEIIELKSYRVTCNQKLWAKVASTNNGATATFLVGLHLYPVAAPAFSPLGP